MNQRSVRNSLNTIKERVRSLLERDVRCRNNDKHLILEYLKDQGYDVRVEDSTVWEDGRFVQKPHIVWRIVEEQFGAIPAFETITRCRRAVQNTDGEFLPTDPHVVHARGIREGLVREYFAGDVKFLREYETIVYGIK